ncbi:MAG TPA: hypothetical protein VD884_06805 [Ohtaekwangia sp.]|nr:hypothetical protein [Ohtaekwangia sp.]
MKTHKWITTVAIFIFSSSGVWAQHDLVKEGNPVTGMTTEQARDKSTVKEADRIKIKPTEVPPLLRNTLGQNEFEGWEENDLYYDRTSGHYSLEIDTVHHYLFDQDGNRIEPPYEDDLPETTSAPDTAGVEGLDD